MENDAKTTSGPASKGTGGTFERPRKEGRSWSAPAACRRYRASCPFDATQRRKTAAGPSAGAQPIHRGCIGQRCRSGFVRHGLCHPGQAELRSGRRRARISRQQLVQLQRSYDQGQVPRHNPRQRLGDHRRRIRVRHGGRLRLWRQVQLDGARQSSPLERSVPSKHKEPR